MHREPTGKPGGARRVVRMFLLTLAALGCLPPGAVQARPTSAFRVRLPGSASEGKGAGNRAVHGNAALLVPRAWRRDPYTNNRTTGHLAVRLSPRCEATIEVNTWIGVLRKSPSLEIESAMDFWFEVFAPTHPRPLPLVGHHTGKERAWALATPPASYVPAPLHISPYYGVPIQRLPRTHLWTSVSIGVRTEAACVSSLPHRSSLQSALETTLRTASFLTSLN
jgi:hypothetical protein